MRRRSFGSSAQSGGVMGESFASNTLRQLPDERVRDFEKIDERRKLDGEDERAKSES